MFKSQQDQLNKLSEGMADSKGHPAREDIEVLDVINNKIHKLLTSVLENTKSDRAYVYLYHNGGVSSSGLFFQRMTCISEVVSEGVLPVSDRSQNLHKSSYSNMCSSLKSTGKWFVSNTDDLRNQDNFLYEKALCKHAESIYTVSLRNNYDSPIGFIGIDYCSVNYSVDESVISKELKSSATKISSLVDIKSEVES